MTDADRFDTPLYGVGEAAAYLDVPSSTLTTWAFGYERRPSGRNPVRGRPVITAFLAERRHDAAIPFVGLAEGYVLAAFRHAGVPLQRIRPAIDALKREIGVHHALASRRLYTDGAEVLFDFAEQSKDDLAAASARELVVVRNNQRVFAEVIESHLRRVDFDTDGYVRLIRLPQYRHAEVTVDADHAFGRPRFAHGGARVEDVIDLFRSGEQLNDVATEFGLTGEEVEDAVRVATRFAA